MEIDKHRISCFGIPWLSTRGGLGRPAAGHLQGGPVGPPARWAGTSNAERVSGTEKVAQGPLAREGRALLI